MRVWLKEKREQYQLTQARLAQEVGVSEQYIYYIEAGERRPSPEIAQKIADTLGFHWTRFFSDDQADALLSADGESRPV